MWCCGGKSHGIAADLKIAVMLLVVANRTRRTISSKLNKLASFLAEMRCGAEQYHLKFLFSVCYFIGLLVVSVWRDKH